MAFLGIGSGSKADPADSAAVSPDSSFSAVASRLGLYPRPPTDKSQDAYNLTPEESQRARLQLASALAGDTTAFIGPGRLVDEATLKLIKNHLTEINSKLVEAGQPALLTADELKRLVSESGVGPELTSAFRKFQGRFGLDSDGKVHDRDFEGRRSEHDGCLKVDGIAGTWTLTTMQALLDNGVKLTDKVPESSPFAGLTRSETLDRIRGGFWYEDIGTQFRPTFSQEESPDIITRSRDVRKEPNPLVLNRGGGTVSRDVVLGASPTALMATLADCAWNRMVEYTKAKGVPQSSSTHQCARIPRLAFGDCDITDGQILGNGQAKSYVAALRAHPGFKEVTGVRPADLEALPAGCIVIYRNPNRSDDHAGHMEVTVERKRRDDGSLCSAVSDFGQNSRLAYARVSDLHVFIPIDPDAQVA